MSIAVRNIILQGQRGPRLDQAMNGTFYTPEIRADAAEETLYTLTIEGLEGAPASASYRVWFEMAHRNTRGVYGKGFGEDNFVDKGYKWVTMNAVDHAGLLPDGDWPTRVANQASTFPLTLTRRIKGGFSHRLRITCTTGGGGRTGTGDTTSGSKTVAYVTGTLLQGELVTGPGIPAATVVTAVGAGTLTLSNAATATATGVSLASPASIIQSVEAKVIYA